MSNNEISKSRLKLPYKFPRTQFLALEYFSLRIIIINTSPSTTPFFHNNKKYRPSPILLLLLLLSVYHLSVWKSKPV